MLNGTESLTFFPTETSLNKKVAGWTARPDANRPDGERRRTRRTAKIIQEKRLLKD